MMDKNKDSQAAVLKDLQNEINSLKSLMGGRRGEDPTSGSKTKNSFSFGQKATLPAWQLADSKDDGAKDGEE